MMAVRRAEWARGSCLSYPSPRATAAPGLSLGPRPPPFKPSGANSAPWPSLGVFEPALAQGAPICRVSFLAQVVIETFYQFGPVQPLHLI